MVNRIFFLVLLLFAPARAQEAFDPATVMPAETLAYAEFDAGALQRGFNSLDIVRTVFADEFKSFFGPLLEDLPVDDLKSMKPVRDWVAGHAAIGLSGFSIRLRGLDGKYERVRFAKGAPIDPRLFNLLMIADMTRGAPEMIVDFEGVAVIEPGEKLRNALDAFLETPPVPFTHKFVQRGARQILTLKFEPFREDGVWYAPEIHADLTGDRWVFATSAEMLRDATTRRTSLREDEKFLETRARHTAGERVLFCYADFERALEIAKPMLPGLVREAMVLNGIESMRNAALGVSVVDGGVRESFGVGLQENPTGFWKLLGACPPGLRSIEKIPPRALGLLAVKFDNVLFDKLFTEVTAELLPGVGRMYKAELAGEFLALGIDYETEVLPAFGDERAIAFFPSAGFTPEMLMAMDVRNEQVLRVLIAKASGALAGGPFQIGATESGWKLSGPLPARFQLHKGHLLGSTNPAILRRVIATWDVPEKTMAKDSEMFRRVMNGLNGGKTDDLVALAYGDIRSWLPQLLALGAMAGALDGPLNPKPMPDVHKLASNFSGVAIGLRRDSKGVALDGFGPLGLWTMGTLAIFQSAAAPIVFEVKAEPR
jgi:hypothetical protein